MVPTATSEAAHYQNADVFALNESKLEYTLIVGHHVKIIPPSNSQRVPFVHRDVIAGMVKSMEQQSVGKPSCPRKKDGTKRFCADCRHLSAITKISPTTK